MKKNVSLILTVIITLSISILTTPILANRPANSIHGSNTPAALPVIFTMPKDTSICPGYTAKFTASAYGGTVSIQWQISINGSPTFSDISGATDSILTFPVTSVSQNANAYRAVFTNSSGSDTSGQATLTVFYIDNLGSAHGDTCIAEQLGRGVTYQWLMCGSQQPIAGATTDTFIATTHGAYRCIVYLAGCSDTTACLSTWPASVEDIGANHFSIYPNPTQGTFVISTDHEGTLSIQIISLLSDKLREYGMNGTEAQFDISDLPTGIYQALISDGRQTIKVLKVIKD